MPKSNWTKLCAVTDCPAGQAKFVSAGSLDLAVFHLTLPDRFAVTQAACPHAGANLAAGELTGQVVTCHWHQWAFDLDTGVCLANGAIRLRRYECRVENGCVWACLDQAMPAPSGPFGRS